MFAYDEICEISALCEENQTFAKYVEKFKGENDRLLNKVTHELGNHLTLISSTAQLMENRNPEVRDIKYWVQLRDDIESMKELFFSFSKYKYGDCLDCKKTDVTELVDEIVESFQAAAIEKNVSVTMEEPPLDDEIISYVCDSVKIRQVIINLLKNALEAVDKGGKIWVRILGKENNSDSESKNSYFKIEVANNGELIEEEKIKTIFDIQISSKGEGRGMGLPLALRIIEAHKGKIEVSSEEVNGERKTVFSICLPV